MQNENKKTILVVEDEDDVMDYLVTFFEDNDYVVITATNGNSGFKTAKEKHPDLISLDLSMPGESGLRLYKNLNETRLTADIPIFIITGFSSEFKDFFGKLKKGESPAGYFEKPIDREALLNKIKETIG
jgi:DNA-binding response OmpR family regulator